MLKRKDLQKLALQRLKDAELLYRARSYNAAAEMCGFALEFALKACVCRRLRINEYPEKELEGAFKKHRYEDLLLLAGLRDLVAAPGKQLPSWSAATSWKPERRYQPVGSTTKRDAEDMLKALRDPTQGVVPWLKRHW